MNSAQAYPETAPNVRSQGTVRGWLRLLFDPVNAFRAMDGGRAAWAAPLLVLAALSILATVAHEWAVPVEDRIEARIEQAEQLLGRPLRAGSDEEAAAAYMPAVGIRLVFVGAATIAMAAVVAGVVAIVIALCGHAMRFSRVLAVVSQAMLPPSVSWTLCLSLLLLLKAPSDIDPLRPDAVVVSNPAGFVDTSQWSPFLRSIAVSLDVFSMWTAALTAIGLAATSPRLGLAKALTIVVMVWAGYVLFKGILATVIPALG